MPMADIRICTHSRSSGLWGILLVNDPIDNFDYVLSLNLLAKREHPAIKYNILSIEILVVVNEPVRFQKKSNLELKIMVRFKRKSE